MLKNNKVINELYNKINEYKKLRNLTYKRRSNFYAMVSIISILAICVGAGKFASNLFFMTSFMFILLVSFFASMYMIENDDIFSIFWIKSEKMLAENRQAIVDYISKEETQIEILNFKFNDKLETSVNNLKIFLASKEYYDAYEMFHSILISENYFEEYQLTETQNQKIIAEYELGLKMKL